MGLEDPAIADLFARHWAWSLESSPEWATEHGVHLFDDRLSDNSLEALEREKQERKAFLEEARALQARGGASASDATALALLIEGLEADVSSEVCAFEEWSISARGNPVTRFNYLPELHVVNSPEDGDKLIKRYLQIAKTIDRDIENLRRGLGKGLVTNAETLRRVTAMVKTQLDQNLADWPLMDPTEKDHVEWPSGKAAAYRAQIARAVEVEIKPALARYLRFLESELAPKARGQKQTGVSALPIGKECYQARIRNFTSLPLTAHELHETGKREVARIDAEMEALGKKLFKSKSRAETLKKLRTDPALHFKTAEEVEAKASSALAAAKAKIPEYFGVLPKAECIVARIPDYEAPYTTIAYYRAPVPDGSKPGRYFVNVYAPETRPRYEAAALAFHESIPGHHLQIALAQELDAVPAYRKHAGTDAFVEGWALYTERLAEEMGLYENDLDRMGMLSFDAWRATRLVVDTGIHAFGWSRSRAVKYMLEHSALAENNIVNEVDRYIVWPGQALAYKTGQLEILKLRREAEQKLGDKFDLRAFHDAVLLGGAVSLPVLRAQVERYVASASAAAAAAAK